MLGWILVHPQFGFLRAKVEANAHVLMHVAEKWVEVFDFEGSGSRPRTFPLKLVSDQASRKKSSMVYLAPIIEKM